MIVFLLGNQGGRLEKGDQEKTPEDSVANTFCDTLRGLETGLAKAAAKLGQKAKLETGDSTPVDSRYNIQIDLHTERSRIQDVNGQSQESIHKVATGVNSEIPAPPPAPAMTLKQILALDLNIESITRYQPKPKSMYTFLCAQQFRRDEYAWHFKNVHSDIHGGLSGWIEHRCPLAHYGCTYSLRRLNPAPKGSKLVHNNVCEAFGVQPKVPKIHTIQKYDNPLQDDLNTNVPKGIEELEITIRDKMPQNKLSGNSDTKESTPEIFTSKDYDSAVNISGNPKLLKGKGDSNKINCDSKNLVDPHPGPDKENVTTNKIGADDVGRDCKDGEDESVFVMEKETCDDKDTVIKYCEDILYSNKGEDEAKNVSAAEITDSGPTDMLCTLPFEILSHITGFLDPFSLGNLALTSKVLREVACNQLETRGIVILQWEKQLNGTKTSWQTTFKVI